MCRPVVLFVDMPLQLALQKMGGEVVQFEARSSLTLLQLKEHVMDMKFIKTADQVLIMGGIVLGNRQSLLSLIEWFVLGDLLPEDDTDSFVFELDLDLVVLPKTCKSCGSYARSKCSGCAAARYCSRECQTIHWPVHRQECEHAMR